MRMLNDDWQEPFQANSSKPVTPAGKISGPVDPKEMKLYLDTLGVPSSGHGPPPKPRPAWLKVQLERLRQFFLKLVRDANYRP